MKKPNKVVILIMDSVGCGASPDAVRFGDESCDTLGHVSQHVGGLKIPNLQSLGLGNIHNILGCPEVKKPLANFGKMQEASPGKDTTTGHWEMAGLVLKEEFPVYKNGFPEEIIKPFEEATGRKVMGNKPSSGTVILDELGEKHMKNGEWIVYTSGDSVFQIAAHEEVIPIEELYEACKIARKMLDPYKIGRVIARPFVGEPGSFKRTYNRHDYSILPGEKTLLDKLVDSGIPVWGVGKISDIFAGQGISKSFPTKGNKDGMMTTVKCTKEIDSGLIFTNLVDFDSAYGHRNNPEGYAKALEEFDQDLPEVIDALSDGDWLMISADHGCDPTYLATTDHSREYVPFIFYVKGHDNGVNLGIRESFADLGQTIADGFGIDSLGNGVSALKEIS